MKQREDQLRRDHARLAKGMDRLLTAYQECLVSLEQLRCRMPELRQQDQAIKSELQSLETVAGDQAVSTLGRDAGRFPCTITGTGGDAGRARTAEDPATTGEGGSRGPGNDHHSTFDSDAEFRARSERSTEAASRASRHRWPNPTHVIFCVQTVNTPATMSPSFVVPSVKALPSATPNISDLTTPGFGILLLNRANYVFSSFRSPELRQSI